MNALFCTFFLFFTDKLSLSLYCMNSCSGIYIVLSVLLYILVQGYILYCLYYICIFLFKGLYSIVCLIYILVQGNILYWLYYIYSCSRIYIVLSVLYILVQGNIFYCLNYICSCLRIYKLYCLYYIYSCSRIYIYCIVSIIYILF